jgi:hypothetical protein
VCKVRTNEMCESAVLFRAIFVNDRTKDRVAHFICSFTANNDEADRDSFLQSFEVCPYYVSVQMDLEYFKACTWPVGTFRQA